MCLTSVFLTPHPPLTPVPQKVVSYIPVKGSFLRPHHFLEAVHGSDTF